ncbi:MAG: ClpXP protease specificity-enhancing factor [Sodalis sp. (in: enterobacteria)]|uniref:ClpXP protease specificity-enhancing factor n=1 Tax=Sodalis sp. (in: enterobacteria) TaxID=1898979 RepID=UPI003F2FB39A
MEVTQLSPRRPYLLRAFYEWLLDNQLTPHLVADVTVDGVMMPMEFARDGQIVLNIAPRAVTNLTLGNDDVQFNARFGGGVPRQVVVPMAAVLAVYARENGAGTMFEPEVAYEQLTRADDDSAEEPATETVMSVIDGARPDNAQAGDPEDEPPPPRSGGRPSLRVVK